MEIDIDGLPEFRQFPASTHSVSNQSGQIPGVNQSQVSSSQRPPPAAASGSNGAVVTSVVAVGDVGIRIEHLWWWSDGARRRRRKAKNARNRMENDFPSKKGEYQWATLVWDMNQPSIHPLENLDDCAAGRNRKNFCGFKWFP
nr:hypothetical protein Iba_chr08dCG11170 [Ipomoea batatas]